MTTLVGRSLGRYKLEALLGRGGMAEVYRATDTRLSRSVAVKVIHGAHASEPQFLERFLREARVVASLEHPNILPIYDFGEEGGMPFLVMPYLPGGSLRERTMGRAVPLPQAAMWISQLAGALDAAHAAGVLHRDVKPANVLIGKDDRLALADFGIAKMMESITGLTATGVVVGTPLYMAPEQAQGRPASPATDRYALGAIAFELLAGRPPFEGDNPLSLMHQHVTTPPPALSSKVGGLPAGLDAVFARALAKDPAERPPSCRALAEAVAAYVPTGMIPVSESLAAWGTPTPSGTKAAPQPTRTTRPQEASGETEPTVVQTPRPLPGPSVLPPTVVGSNTPSLTSDQTIVRLSDAARARRRMAVAVAAVVGLAAVAGVLVMRLGTSPSSPASSVALLPAASPVPPPAVPPAPPSSAAVPAPVPDAAPAATAGIAGKALPQPPAKPSAPKAVRPPPTPTSPPKAPTPEPRVEGRAPAAEDSAAAEELPGRLDEIHKRLDPSTHPGHRLTQADFAFALGGAREILSTRPNNAEANYLEAYAQGGLEYVAGRDAAAGRAVIAAAQAARKAGKRELRWTALMVPRPDGGFHTPAGWELAVAYGDARGEGEALVAAELAKSPGQPRALLGRAALSHMQAKFEAAAADAKTAYGAAANPFAAAGIAAFIADESARAHQYEEALKWYRTALRVQTPASGAVAYRAAKIAREKLNRETDANELFQAACRAGNREACKETGGSPLPRLRRRGG